TALQQGSVERNIKFDEEFGESAAIGLAEFYQYWHHLPNEIKNRLGACRTHHAEGRTGGTTLASELKLLERWLKKDTQNMNSTQKKNAWQEVDHKENRPCINTIQRNLLAILNANKTNANNISVLDEVPESEANGQKVQAVEPSLDIQYGKDGLLPEYPLDKIFTDICQKVTDLRQCMEIMAVLGTASNYKAQQQQLRTRFIALMNALPDTEDKGAVLFNRLYELNNDGEHYELCAQLIDEIGHKQLIQWHLNEESIKNIIKHIYEKKNIVKGYEAFNKLDEIYQQFNQFASFKDFIAALKYINKLNDTAENKKQIISAISKKYQSKINALEINGTLLLDISFSSIEERLMIFKCLDELKMIESIKNLEDYIFGRVYKYFKIDQFITITCLEDLIRNNEFELIKLLEPYILKLEKIPCNSELKAKIIIAACQNCKDNGYDAVVKTIVMLATFDENDIRPTNNHSPLAIAYKYNHQEMISDIIAGCKNSKMGKNKVYETYKNVLTIVMQNKDSDRYNILKRFIIEYPMSIPDDFLMLHSVYINTFDDDDRKLFILLLDSRVGETNYVLLLKAAIENNHPQQALVILKHFIYLYNNNQIKDKNKIFKSIMCLIMDYSQYDLFTEIRSIISVDGYLEVLKNDKEAFFYFIKFLSKCINNDHRFNDCKHMIGIIIDNNPLLFSKNESGNTPFTLSCYNNRIALYILDDYMRNISKLSEDEKKFTIKKILSVASNHNPNLSETLLNRIEVFLKQHLTLENIPEDFLLDLCRNSVGNLFQSRLGIINYVISLDPNQLVKGSDHNNLQESPLKIAISKRNQTLVMYLCKTFHNYYKQLSGDKFQAFFTLDVKVLEDSNLSDVVNSYRINPDVRNELNIVATDEITREYWLDYLRELYYSGDMDKRDKYLVAYNKLCSADDGKEVKTLQKQRSAELLEWIAAVKAILQPIEDVSRSQDPGRYALKYIRSIHENYGLRHWLPKLLTLPFVVLDLIPRWEQKDEYRTHRDQLYNSLFSIYEDCMLSSDDCKKSPNDMLDSSYYYNCNSMLGNQDHMKIYDECHDYAGLLYRSRWFITLIMLPCILLVLVKSAEIKLLKKPFSFLEFCFFGRYQSTTNVDNKGPLAHLLDQLFAELYVLSQSEQIKVYRNQLKNVETITADNLLDMLDFIETSLKDYQYKIDTLPAYEVIKEHELPQFSPQNVLAQMEAGESVSINNSDVSTKMPLLTQASRNYGSSSSSSSSSRRSVDAKKSKCQIM
ncbi:MAG: hypothetical protein ABSF18_04250, partial [Gammaproteobacteria bacterium]